jgi:hypothetical protein
VDALASERQPERTRSMLAAQKNLMVTELEGSFMVCVRNRVGLESEITVKHCRRFAYLTWSRKRGVDDVDVDVDVNVDMNADVEAES